MIEFIAKYIGSTALILITLSIDNIFWISSSPEYSKFKKMSLQEKLRYIFSYRIKTVFTDKRDVAAALIGGLILALIV